MGQTAVCLPMAAYRGAPSIAALRERFLADEPADADAYEVRYGRDAPRFLDTGAFTMRPTARHLLAPLPVVRVGVHPGDVGVRAILRSIDSTITTLRIAREPARYGDLQEGAAPVPQPA